MDVQLLTRVILGQAEVRRRLRSSEAGEGGKEGDEGAERVAALVCYGLGSVQRSEWDFEWWCCIKLFT